MKLSAIIPVALGVISNPLVIGTAIVIILYLNFVYFVARYKKKTPKPKKRRASPPPAASSNGGAGQEDNGAAGGEAQTVSDDEADK